MEIPKQNFALFTPEGFAALQEHIRIRHLRERRAYMRQDGRIWTCPDCNATINYYCKFAHVRSQKHRRALGLDDDIVL